MTRVLAIGKSGRLDCIVEALYRSDQTEEIYSFSEVSSPGLQEKSELKLGDTENYREVLDYAIKCKPDLAIIGPEEPLKAGVADRLKELGIPCIGPTERLAQIEWSKSFTRDLLSKYDIPGNPEYRVFNTLEGIESYLRSLGNFVVKPDGLTSGKGVRILGEHLHSINDSLEYCESVLKSGHKAVIVEEKLDGEEFSFQSFCDGDHVIDSIPVQDHKRAFDGDMGPNTGGMGSYSCEDHSLPFLEKKHITEASQINQAVAKALQEEIGECYKGILYGGFIVTKDGLRLIEYNCRFGDPEVMNILPLLTADFIDVCEAIITGTLDKIDINFQKKATVCKYIVPEGYPTSPRKGERIFREDIPEPHENLKVYYGAVDSPSGSGNIYLTGSRSMAFVGLGETLAQAEQLAENAASRIRGRVSHRKDIGTSILIQKRVDHMKQLQEQKLFGRKNNEELHSDMSLNR